ncbi:MAG: hypothetical protein ACREEC_00545 [Thermoplasmata archaeon]
MENTRSVRMIRYHIGALVGIVRSVRRVSDISLRETLEIITQGVRQAWDRPEVDTAPYRKMVYQDYLLTPHWKEMREIALDWAEHRCQMCYQSEPLAVHHRTYARLGHEWLSDLIVTCNLCHAAADIAKKHRSGSGLKRVSEVLLVMMQKASSRASHETKKP